MRHVSLDATRPCVPVVVPRQCQRETTAVAMRPTLLTVVLAHVSTFSRARLALTISLNRYGFPVLAAFWHGGAVVGRAAAMHTSNGGEI